MKRVNVADAKSHLSEYLREVKRGETLVICERNLPIAELRPYDVAKRAPEDRPFGIFTTPSGWTDCAFAPMTDEDLADWEGPVLG